MRNSIWRNWHLCVLLVVLVMRNASLLSAYSLQANQHNVSFKETRKIWLPLAASLLTISIWEKWQIFGMTMWSEKTDMFVCCLLSPSWEMHPCLVLTPFKQTNTMLVLKKLANMAAWRPIFLPLRYRSYLEWEMQSEETDICVSLVVRWNKSFFMFLQNSWSELFKNP